ncbi:MAG: TonB C-terminal domain-containing protein [Bdellovibrionales bacterium]|nr:TonB C-terminal domain-containing protein [Bdellovibrionales bacterium]NQZ18563.1 TonB C-terminal domain-containing protein [Bdellovibrionales bacterium]
MKRPKDSFNKYIFVSVAFHLVVVAFLTVRVLFFPEEAVDIKSAVRIDVVALPEKQTTPPKPAVEKKPEPVAKKEPPKPKEKPKPKPKPKPVEKKKPKVALKKKKLKETKNEQDSALARLKAMQKLKNKKKQATPPQEYKGNEVSKGNSLSGLDKLKDDSYKSDLETHIKSHWVLPEWLRDAQHQAVIIVFISKTGSITNKTFLTKSGNKLFDEQVLSTLEKANPLPKPPSNLIDLYANKGVRVSFP